MSDYKPVFVDTEREKHAAEIAKLQRAVDYNKSVATYQEARALRFKNALLECRDECRAAHKGIARLRRRLDRARREASGQAGWVLVSKCAPLVGQLVLVANGDEMQVDWWTGKRFSRSGSSPTHWRPLIWDAPGPKATRSSGCGR